jgi:TPR repeat protein
MGVCYYYGRGVDRDVAHAMTWFRKSAAVQGNAGAVQAVQMGIPGKAWREDIVRFTNAGSAPPRHAAAHEFANGVYEDYLKPQLQIYNDTLQEFDSLVPHKSLRDSM